MEGEDIEEDNNQDNNGEIVNTISSSEELPLRALMSPSHKKRRRSTPEKKFNTEDDDDGANCTICLDNFQSNGSHRLVALKCGHIFGESCIRRWLQEAAPPLRSCPQCKTKANQRDIRFIYTNKVHISDNSREVSLQLQLHQLEEQKKRLSIENSLHSSTIIAQRAEIRRLKDEIELLKNSAQLSAGIATAGIRTIKRGKMYLEKNLDFKENLESRLLKYLSRNRKLIITQKSSETSLFPGYGVKLVDLTSYRQEKFINTSNKILIDFSVDSNETSVITASKEATCKVFNLTSNASVSSYTPTTVPIWSCSFDDERPNNLYLGAQNGITYIYDTRNPSDPVKEVVANDNRSPVKYTIPMKRTEVFPLGGFFIVHMRGIYFYEYLPTTEIASTTLNFNEPILVVSYDDRTEMLLITKSPSGQGSSFKQTRHVLMKLIKEEGIPVLQEIYSFNGSSSSLPAFSRPAQIKVPDGFIVVSYLQDTKMLQARSSSIGMLHEASVSDTITAVCPIYIEGAQLFGALSQSRCRLFKISLDY